jgi:hypothetical protein
VGDWRARGGICGDACMSKGWMCVGGCMWGGIRCVGCGMCWNAVCRAGERGGIIVSISSCIMSC